MTGAQIVAEVVQILTAGIQSFAQSLGQGISTFAQSLAMTTSGNTTELSVFFILVLVFASVGLVIGLTTRIFLWLSSLGN